MLSSTSTVANGDTVVLHFSHSDMRALVVQRGQVLNCKAGIFQHDDFIGAAYGTRVRGRACSKSDLVVPTVLVLRLTPELWTICLKHRTQILYMTDIAVIVQHLRLKPGSVVAEAGTGSGSLTHSLARAVAPHGKVYTFDFHKHRAEEAKGEFAAHGLGDVVISGWSDVCRDDPQIAAAVAAQRGEAPAAVPERGADEPQSGYGLPAASVDAVFLDVPAPWLAVNNVLHVLRPGGVVCSFSPCVEQTQKMCAALRESDEFLDLHTVESLTREHIPVFPPASAAPGKRERDATVVAEGGAETAQPARAQPSARGEGVLLKPRADGKGHSAFLTFARRRLHVPSRPDAGAVSPAPAVEAQ